MKKSLKLRQCVLPSFFGSDSINARRLYLTSIKVPGARFEDRESGVHQDISVQKLKSAAEINSILCDIKKNSGVKLSNEYILQALRSLFLLSKHERLETSNGNIIQSPEFKILCQNLISRVRSLEINDVIDALKTLIYHGVQVKANVIQVLLQMIAKQVNELSLQQIIFLDFLLKDFEFCPLSEALKIALPIVFETHVETQAELKNISQLCKLLHFACRRHLSQQTVAFLIKSVLDEATRLDLKSAKIVVHSICELDTIDDNSVLLLHQALDVIVNNKSKCSYSDFDVILSKLASKFSQKRFYLYHENFLHSATSFIVERQRSFEEGVWIVKKASKFGFVNLKLLGYLAAKAERVPHVLSDCGTLILFSFVGGLSLADYRPNNWNILEPLILKNAFSHIGAVELPWMKFALDLCTLDCWPLKLLDSLFNCDFLSKYLSRDYNMLDYLQLLSLHQAVTSLCPWYSGSTPPPTVIKKSMEVNGANVKEYPLEQALVKGLGCKEFVVSGLYTKMGHFIDHVIFLKEGHPVNVQNEKIKIRNDGNKIYIEEIEMFEGCKMIAVLYLPASSYCVNTQRLRGPDRIRISSLEVIGPSVVPVNSVTWVQLLESEKIPYLMQKIKEKYEKVYA